MNAYVAVGTVLALVLVVLRCVGPHEWKHPSKWRFPEIGPSILVLFGSNALTSAIKLFVIVAMNDLRVQGVHGLEGLSSEDVILFIGGAFGAFLVGLATIREGWGGVVT